MIWQKIIQVNLYIIQQLAVEGRWFLAEAEVQWSENQQSKGMRRVFLFTDILLVVKRTGRTLGKSSKYPFTYREKITVKDLQLLGTSDAKGILIIFRKKSNILKDYSLIFFKL